MTQPQLRRQIMHVRAVKYRAANHRKMDYIGYFSSLFRKWRWT